MQEVSGFDGHDEGDNWKVHCRHKTEYWQRSGEVGFEHVITSALLNTQRSGIL